MSYLRLEKAVMTNLEESLRRELLRTNRSGAYSASTLVDCNTRKYHGLLVVRVPIVHRLWWTVILENIMVCSLFPYQNLTMRTTSCFRRSTVR